MINKTITLYGFILCTILIALSSCAKALTPAQAANGSYKKCRSLK